MSHCVYDVDNNNNDIVKHSSNTQINSLSAKLSNFNFHSLEVVSRYRDSNFHWVNITHIFLI